MSDNFNDFEYLIISPEDVPYTSKWGLEAHFTCYFPNEKEGEMEFSLLDFSGSNLNDEKDLDMYRFKQNFSCSIKIYPSATPDTHYDLLAYRYKKLNEINDTLLSKRILEWENKVRYTINSLNPQTEARIEIFVKVFTFIKLGYSTKYKRLAEICSMPLNLYLDFEKEYDDYISQ